jgi:hypothetical protein
MKTPGNDPTLARPAALSASAGSTNPTRLPARVIGTEAAPPDFMAETMRLDEFRRRYRVSLMTAYKWIEAGLPSMKIGRDRLVHVPTADAWVHGKLTAAALVSGGGSGERP